MGGEFRNFEYSFQTWFNKCLKNFQYDLFMSTWSESHLFSNRLLNIQDKNFVFEVNEEKVLSITKTAPKFLNIEKEIHFDHKGNKQIYHWQKLLINLINYKTEYDFAIITRPDVSVETGDANLFPNQLKKCQANEIYGESEIVITPPPAPFISTIHDIYFMSSPSTLIDSLLPLPYMEIKSSYEISQGKGDNMHTHLSKYFISKNQYVTKFQSGIILDSSELIRSKNIII